MKELLPQIIRWTREEKPFALARVIQTWGSSPRPVGSAMIISAGLEMCGSVSGGCVEGAVLKEVARIIETHGAKVLSYGVNDNEAWSVGLTCGGQIKVYLQFWPSIQMEVRELLIKSLSEDRIATMITALVDDENRNMAMDDSGKIRGDEMPVEVVTRAREAVTRRTHEAVTVGETTVVEPVNNTMQAMAKAMILFFKRLSTILVNNAAFEGC